MTRPKKSGDELLNIYRIARKAGVSISTVSRVLNNKSSVAAGTRRAVMECIESLGYVPKVYKNREVSLGIVCQRGAVFTNYLMEIVNGITAFAAEHGLRLSIFSLSEKDVSSRGLLGYAREFGIDGLIILQTGDDSDYLLDLKKESVPFVILNNRLGDRVNYIDVDNVRGIELAMSHLFALGHARIAFIAGDQSRDNFRDRLSSYRSSLRKNGKKLDEKLVAFASDRAIPHNHLHEGYAQMQALLAGRGRFTAVVCSSDEFALGAIRALSEAGIAVPRDVSVVGFDDYMISAYTLPPLTTVRQPLYDMGFLAAREVTRLAERQRRERPLARSTESVRRIMTPELVIRASTAPPRK